VVDASCGGNGLRQRAPLLLDAYRATFLASRSVVLNRNPLRDVESYTGWNFLSAPAKFKPAPNQQEFEKLWSLPRPAPADFQLAPHTFPTRPNSHCFRPKIAPVTVCLKTTKNSCNVIDATWLIACGNIFSGSFLVGLHTSRLSCSCIGGSGWARPKLHALHSTWIIGNPAVSLRSPSMVPLPLHA